MALLQKTSRIASRAQLRTPWVSQIRRQTSYEAPKAQPVNLHRQYYKNQGYPLLKAVLIAVTTYQLLYYGWLKLESLETKADQDGQVRSLKEEVKSLVKDRRAS